MSCRVRVVADDGREALVEDSVGPSRADDAGVGNPDQQVAQRRGVQNARVIHDRERHRSVPQAVFLRLRSQFVHDLPAVIVVSTLVSHQVAKPDAPVRTDPPVRELASLEQLDQIRPGHVEDVSRLLGAAAVMESPSLEVVRQPQASR
jgi:hypothetical protein